MEENVYNAIKKPLEEIGIELLEVRLGEESGVTMLHVVIDSEDAVDTNLCVKATKVVDPIIDSLNLDLENYILDVGSKGVSE